MGLCKCPKRQVTTQFCFEHRVNVCENCMVVNHTKVGIIQSKANSDENTNFGLLSSARFNPTFNGWRIVILILLVPCAEILWMTRTVFDLSVIVSYRNRAKQDFIKFFISISDVFHWKCLNAKQQSLPANTAPGGHTCPTCSDPIFPPVNLVSPVADVLRTRLGQVNWARNVLELPLVW